MREYTHYILSSESNDSEVFVKYSDGFASYMRTNESATLYGVDEFGNNEVIFSK